MNNWSSWSDFVAMGGYGLYVWGSFGMCVVVLMLELGLLASRRRAVRRDALDNNNPLMADARSSGA